VLQQKHERHARASETKTCACQPDRVKADGEFGKNDEVINQH